VLSTIVLAPHPKICPSQIAVFFLPHPVFSKSTYNIVFSPIGFENNITRVAAVIRDALPKPFSKVFHHYVGHPWANGGNFLANIVLKCFEGLRSMFINLDLEVSPQ